MVLESLLSVQNALRRPHLALVAGFLYASLAILLSVWIFKDQASMVLVFLTTFAFVPLFFQFLQTDELAGVQLASERAVLVQHGRTLLSMLSLFVGMSTAFGLWFVVLPTGPAIFSVQSQTIASLTRGVTGGAVSTGMLFVILLNNLKVMVFCFLFSLIYGFGALFILTWNASVIGTALGAFTERNAGTALSTGAHSLVAYVGAGGMSFVRYFIHGIPEIAAYFIAAIAGGMLSVAIVNKRWSRDSMDRILLDTSNLLLIGVGVCVVAGLVEVFLTPLLV